MQVNLFPQTTNSYSKTKNVIPGPPIFSDSVIKGKETRLNATSVQSTKLGFQEQSEKLITTGKSVHTETVNQLREVQGIVMKVDKEFQTRKEEAIQLSWKISELQNQLEYVSRINEEDAQANASRNAQLSWLKQQCKHATDVITNLEKNAILPLKEAFQFYQITRTTASEVVAFNHSDMSQTMAFYSENQLLHDTLSMMHEDYLSSRIRNFYLLKELNNELDTQQETLIAEQKKVLNEMSVIKERTLEITEERGMGANDLFDYCSGYSDLIMLMENNLVQTNDLQELLNQLDAKKTKATEICQSLYYGRSEDLNMMKEELTGLLLETAEFSISRERYSERKEMDKELVLERLNAAIEKIESDELSTNALIVKDDEESVVSSIIRNSLLDSFDHWNEVTRCYEQTIQKALKKKNNLETLFNEIHCDFQKKKKEFADNLTESRLESDQIRKKIGSEERMLELLIDEKFHLSELEQMTNEDILAKTIRSEGFVNENEFFIDKRKLLDLSTASIQERKNIQIFIDSLQESNLALDALQSEVSMEKERLTVKRQYLSNIMDQANEEILMFQEDSRFYQNLSDSIIQGELCKIESQFQKEKHELLEIIEQLNCPQSFNVLSTMKEEIALLEQENLALVDQLQKLESIADENADETDSGTDNSSVDSFNDTSGIKYLMVEESKLSSSSSQKSLEDLFLKNL